MALQTITAQTFIFRARALVRQYNRNGTVISDDNNDMKTLQTDGIQFLNMALNEAYRVGDYTKTFEIDNTAADTSNIYTIFTMPDDFAAFEEIINLSEGEVLNFKYVGFNEIYMKNTYTGKANVIYSVKQPEVTALTDEIYVPDLHAQEFIHNFIAARLANRYDPDLVNYFEDKANELLFKASEKGAASEESIVDVYNGYYRNTEGYYG